MIWYSEHLVRALQEARWAERRPPGSRERQGTASGHAVTVALRPATAR